VCADTSFQALASFDDDRLGIGPSQLPYLVGQKNKEIANLTSFPLTSKGMVTVCTIVDLSEVAIFPCHWDGASISSF